MSEIPTTQIITNDGYIIEFSKTLYSAYTGTNNLITVPRSASGSYVLPNGIIVLVDEDIEAYFAGTLRFFYGGDVPVVE